MTVRQTAAENSGFSRNPLRQLGGFALCVVAFFLLVCLVTYDPRDPSFNHSSATQITNAGGYAGAIIADLCQQFLGLAGIMLVLIPIAWGCKLILGRPVSYWWLRVTMMIAGITMLASIFGLFPASEKLEKYFPFGYGGSIGDLITQHFRHLFHSLVFSGLIVASAVISLAIAFGMTWSEWRTLARLTRQGCMTAYAVASTLKGWVLREPKDDEEEEDIEEEEAAPWYRRLAARLPFFNSEDGEEEGEEETDEKPMRRKVAPRISKKQGAGGEGKPGRGAAPKAQPSLALPLGDYALPELNLLAAPGRPKKSAFNEASLAQNARLLESVLRDFGVNGDIVEIRPGPVVTLYELEPVAGTKSSRVIGLADDIARSMSAISARIAVIPGRNAIGIELPNAARETVFLRELLESETYETADVRLPLALGKDIGGTPIVVDLARMPHLLVAGTTGSGKSVAINTMIMSLVYRLTPETCKFIMIDPKMLELSVYEGIPHLLSPVVTEPGKAVVALKWTVKEMENRYRLMSNLAVRNIDGYNKRIREAKAKGKQLMRTVQTGFDPETGQPIIEEVPLEMVELPYIVVVVDEMADLMIVAGKDIESSIQRLAQMARAAGIHIIMATQRPSVDVITGVIKANFPTRISFQVTSRIDSRTILGEQGAEQLLGQGDMLYMAGGGRITRVHGPFVSDKEVEQVVEHLKAQGTPAYIDDITRDEEEEDMLAEGGGEADPLYDQAVSIVTRDRKASTSYIQRCLKVGYNRAATIIEQMERQGVVGPANHVGKREVLARDVDA